MRIVRLTAENVKKLTAVEITPTGALVQITGANGSGKTSVLDSIYYALAGKGTVPNGVVHKGQEHARVQLDLGDIVVTRKFDASGKTTLTVESEDGALFPSPQAMLDELVGPLTFDPLEFSRLAPKGQLERLRRLVPLAVDIDQLDALNARDFDLRTQVNRDLKGLQATLASVPAAPEGTPDERVNTAALMDELVAAQGVNSALDKEMARRNDERFGAAELLKDVAAAREQAAELIREAESGEQEAEGILQELDALEPVAPMVDIAAMRLRIDAANDTNENVQRKANRVRVEAQAAAVKAQSDALTTAMQARTAEKQQAIASAQMPVEGLGFGEGEVTYNGFPFSEASGAEQLRVSVALAMAGNPKLRVLRIKDGSLLDENGLALLAGMAEASDYQVWLERVAVGSKVGIVMHEGTAEVAE